MKTKQSIRKNMELGVLIGLICAIVLSFSGFSSACDNLRGNVLRLHIIANSNSDKDQALKLKVRDQILKSTDIFENCITLEDAIKSAKASTKDIKETAEAVLRENGIGDDVTVEVGESYFDTRHYTDFTLPAGEYKSVIVKIGKANGKNWWCVLFPAVCVPTASDAKLSDTASKKGTKIAENEPEYKIAFKTVEWYQNIKRKLNKKK